MENKMKKFGFEKMLVVLAVAFACVCMWGCSDDIVEFRWEDSRREARIIGFVNDSLAMVGDYRFWHKSTERWNGEYYEDSDAGNPRLCVYNYRVQEDGPRWCDSIAEVESSRWFGVQLTDSVVCGGDLSSYFTLWKIGETPRKIELQTNFEGCSKKIGVRRMHEWIDDKFIALGTVSVNGKNIDNALHASDYGSEYCQYAVLDTVAKSITYKRLDGKLEWVKQCDDVRAWGGDVHCLYYNAQSANVCLKIENKVKDSIWVENQGWYSGAFFEGDLMLVDGNLCEYKDAWVCYPRQGVLKMGFHANNGIILQF